MVDCVWGKKTQDSRLFLKSHAVNVAGESRGGNCG